MSVRRVGWQTQNRGRMVQPGPRATATARQTAVTDRMGPIEIARIVVPGVEGIPPFPILVCRNDGLEQPSGTPAFRSMGNYVALAFGMGARLVARSFQFQLGAPAALRRDPRVWSSVPFEPTDKLNAMLILVAIMIGVTGVIGVTGGIAGQGTIVMEIDPQSGITAGRDRIVKDSNQAFRDRPTQANREWRLRMFR